MLKKNLLVFPLLIALSTNVTGQAYKAYGGYMVGLWSINWTSLNLQSKPEYGMGKFEKAIFLNGGGGAVNVYDRIYIGGAGFTGNVQINGADTTNSTVNRTLSLSSAMVGPYLESNYRPYGNLELNLGVGMYFGETSLNVIKDSGTKSWSNIWNSFGDGGPNPSYVTNKISTTITVVNPYLSLRYPLTPWFGFDLSLGYFLTFYDPNGWEANKSPVADKQEVGLSNTFFKISFIFGG